MGGARRQRKTLERRATALASFLEKISKPRKSKKRRKRPKVDFRQEILVELVAPDGKKKFSVGEEYWNGEYVHTDAMMMWANGGGSVFYFTKQGIVVSARWINSQNLEITIEEGIEYSKRDEWAFFCGDRVDIHDKEL